MTKLPELPRVHKKREADFGVRFREYLEQHPPVEDNVWYELKDTRGKASFPLREIKSKQRAYAHLIQCDKGVLVRVRGVQGEPDYVYTRKTAVYYIIKYPKSFYIIPSDRIENMLGSLSEEMAKGLSINK